MKTSCLVLFFLSAAALAQPQTPPKPASIEGKVVNSVTGEPLRKVELTLSTGVDPASVEAMLAVLSGGPGMRMESKTAKTFTATTDAAGKFRFEPVEPGDYAILSAKRGGYVDGRYKPEGKYSADGKLRLAAGDSLSEVVIRLVPQGAVSGRVLDEDGDPVPGALVSAQSYNYASRRRLMPADAGPANDRGEFRLGKLPPGRYYISANAINMNPLAETPPPPKDGSPETGYVSTYYPSATDLTQATAIDVAGGADLSGFTIQLRKSKVVRLKGKAIDTDGTPLKGGQIMLMNPAHPGAVQMKMIDNPEGRFEIANVQPGSYLVMTMQMTGSSPSVHMQPLVVPAEGLDNVQLGALPEGTVQGRVVVSGDTKVDLQGLSVMIVGGEDAPMMPVLGTVSESGAFDLKKVSAAPYEFSLRPLPEGTYLKSVQWGDREKLGQPLDFSAGFGEPLQVFLGTDGGEFEATVSRDDKPSADATVVLIADNPSARFPETTRKGETDSTGRVKLKDVPPGSYFAFAWEKVEDGQWFDAAFLKAVENRATRVTIQAKGHEKAQLPLIPAAK